MKIFIGADHRGFKLKEELRPWLISEGYQVEDKGAYQLNLDDDFPDFAATVSESVVKESESFGILICGSGGGVSILANKFKGIRCAVGFTVDQIKANRNDDDINILAIPENFIYLEQAENIIKTFLETPFSGLDRHFRRLQKIQNIETQNFK